MTITPNNVREQNKHTTGAGQGGLVAAGGNADLSEAVGCAEASRLALPLNHLKRLQANSFNKLYNAAFADAAAALAAGGEEAKDGEEES